MTYGKNYSKSFFKFDGLLERFIIIWSLLHNHFVKHTILKTSNLSLKFHYVRH